MTVDYASLNDFDLARLQAAAEQWAVLRTEFAGYLTDYETSVQLPVDDDTTWQGSAADAARRGVHATHDRMVATTDYLDAIPTLLHGITTVIPAMDGALAGLSAAQRLASQGATLARGTGATVDGGGNVSLADAAALSNDWDSPAVMAAMAGQSMIYRARWIAEVVNRQIAPQLRYAHKFTPYQGGPWQQDAGSDASRAAPATQAVTDVVNANTKPEQPYRDTPAQPYNWLPVTPDALAEQATLLAGPPGYFAYHGWRNALALFEQWLGNTGRPYLVNPDDMTAAMPTFDKKVSSWIPATEGPFDCGWRNYDPEAGDKPPESVDWWWAMNDFRFRVTGLVSSLPTGERTVEYTLGILKPYVFHPDHPPLAVPGTGGRIGIPQVVLVRQHMCGLSQNFIAQGISHHVLQDPPG